MGKDGYNHLSDARPADLSQAIVTAWGRDARTLGWPQRRDFFEGDALQSLGWNDDRTRVRIFWEDTSDGARVFTEWKPIAGR